MSNKIVIGLILAFALASTIAAIPTAKAGNYDENPTTTAGTVSAMDDPEVATDSSNIQPRFDDPYSYGYGYSYQLHSGFGPQHFSH